MNKQVKHLKTVMTIYYNASTNQYICDDGTFQGEYDSLSEIFNIDSDGTQEYYDSLELECVEFEKKYILNN
jgi:hypothetical protein